MNTVRLITISSATVPELPVAVPIRFTAARRRHAHAAGHYLIQLRQQHRWQWVGVRQEPGPETTGFPR